jgi:sterol desaturase/sphingolipid hydroxylase (fatty acid hydroxylase superfamily)
MPKNYVSNKEETPQLFQSKFIEIFSHTHPAVPAILYLPVVLIFLYLTFFNYQINVFYSILLFLAGMFFWSFTEYNLHRFVFHWVPDSDLGKKLHFIMHGVHHDYPNDPKRLVMPPIISIPLAIFFYFLFYFIIGKYYAAPFFGGFLLGYIYYDTMHYAVHHFPIKNKFFLEIKKHHMKHHYQNEDFGYGVSSPFWDKIYGTDFPKTKSNGTVVGE